MVNAILLPVYWSYVSLCCLLAFWRGGPPERIGAGAMLAAAIISYPFGGSQGFWSVEYALLGIDLALLAVLLVLAVFADRQWTIWAAGFHLVGVLTPVAALMSPTSIRMGYAYLQGFWAYPILLALLLGTVAHRRRVVTNGGDTSWRSFSRR